MKISKIVPQRYKKQYCSIFFDGNDSFRLHKEIIAQYRLQENMDLNEESFSAIKFAGEKKEALEYAQLFLSYRSRSEKEMRERLKRKKFALAVIDSVIQELKEHRLINDLEMAKVFAESSLKTRLWGKHRVRQDLLRKGIEPKLAETIVEEAASESGGEIPSEEERAWQLLLKRKGQIQRLDAHTAYRRLFSYLVRRGFSYDTIEKAMNRYSKEQRSNE